MAGKEMKERILKDFDSFKGGVLGIVLFGSQAVDRGMERSDIDVCLVAPGMAPKELFGKILESRVTQGYDVKIFETLPLYLKGEVLEDGEIVWTSDEGELSYYFYKWRRILNDQKLAYKKLGIEV